MVTPFLYLFIFLFFFFFYHYVSCHHYYIFIFNQNTIFSYYLLFLVRAPLRDKYYGFSCLNNLLIMIILNDTHWCMTSQTFFNDFAMLRNTWLWMFISAIVTYFFSVYFLFLKNLLYCYFYKYLSVSSRFLHWILRYYLLYFLATSSLGHCYLTCEEFFILCILTLSLFLYWEYFKYYESVNFYSQDFTIF